METNGTESPESPAPVSPTTGSSAPGFSAAQPTPQWPPLGNLQAEVPVAEVSQWTRPVPVVTRFGWVVAAVGTVGFIICGRTVFAGLAGMLYVLALVGALIGSGMVKRRWEPVMWLGTAVTVSSALVFRASPWLITLNMFAILALLMVGSLTAQSGSLFQASKPQFFEGLLRASGAWIVSLKLVGSAVKWARSSDRRRAGARRNASSSGESIATRSRFRSLLFAAPVLLMIIPLLRAGDAVFNSVIGKAIRLPVDLIGQISIDGTSVFHGSIGLWGGLMLLGLAGARPRVARIVRQNAVFTPVPRSGTFVSAEAVVSKHERLARDVTGAAWILNAVLAVFAAGQVANAFGLAARLKTEVVSYNQIAKEGFFPLLVASGVILASLVIAHGFLNDRRWETKSVRALQSTIVLAMIVIVVASRRLWIGADIWGLTMLRVLSQASAVLLAVIFAYLAWWQRKPTVRQAVLGISLGAAVTILLCLNLLPIESIIVHWNSSRPAAEHAARFDPSVMDALNPVSGRGLGVASCEDYFDRWHGKNADAALAIGPIAREQVAQGRIDKDCAAELLHCGSNYDTSGLRYNWARSQANQRKHAWCSTQ